MSRRPGELREERARIWSSAAYAYGVIFALGVAYFLVRMPYQISDDLEHMLIAQASSAWDLLTMRYTTSESMRPLTPMRSRSCSPTLPNASQRMRWSGSIVSELKGS